MPTWLLTTCSFVFAFLGLIGIWLSGHVRTRPLGYVVFLVNNVLLLPYSVLSAQWGFAVSGVVTLVLNVRGLRNARRERDELERLRAETGADDQIVTEPKPDRDRIDATTN